MTLENRDKNTFKSVNFINFIRQRLHFPKFAINPTYPDAPERWRTNMGGFDPATPYAEACINYHNHAVTFMIFVVLTVLHSIRK
ncbi:hypothetical protein TpMuguga_02g02025 [Theileria parva strain Muguga]|uniref:uncharacterized protein n=1 Tax=Theileria parva strain Muguga TaxID=333668 RepID=UPI001C61ED2A|nr:uncharacterized protein TpMuguga_02g02025 [Theileria parva strain Muguga]KAF5153695.1 hypothetical protein TpMuguga_02g02025 [Theileria parva strain Muguga]